MTTEDPVTLLFRLGLGKFCTPLRHKIPCLDDWPNAPEATEETVRYWLTLQFNVGFRTGSRSGLIVLDDDQIRHGITEKDRYIAPPTGLVVRTPSGGTHFFYRCPSVPLKNSTSKIAPYCDIRAEGGQTACPPSKNPITGVPYVWISTGEPGELPADVLAALVDAPTDAPRGRQTGTDANGAAHVVHIDMRAPIHGHGNGNGYVEAALHREVHAVRNAPDGTAHDTLNRAAFNLGQLVGGGVLEEGRVRSELIAAVGILGKDDKGARKTIEDGLRDGALEPRGVPERATRTATATVEPEPAKLTGQRTTVRVPGSHAAYGDITYLEQGMDKFCAEVVDAIDEEALYRRSGVIGELHDGQFIPVTPDRMCSIIDNSIRLTAITTKTDQLGEKTAIEVFRTCTRAYASVVLAYASLHGDIRELQHIARYPVCIGAHLTPATPRYNDGSGLYLDCSSVPTPLPLDEARATLDDLVCDFPFATQADRENYFGLLVTVLVRPAIGEPVPMHMIGASVMGSGKSKLAEIVLGCGLLGRPLPATQIGDREDERQKQITAGMVGGDSVIHLDNLSGILDSPALASLLTCAVYRGRLLGHSTMLAIPNDSVLIGSGNNTHTSDEIARRIIPIILQPNTESPENRQDYRHPQLRAYVEEQLPRTRGALLGLVEHWRTAGQRQVGARSVGSFERWSAVVGGIMAAAGYDKWLTNLTGWRGAADDFSAELRAFVKLWAELHSDWWVGTDALFEIADKNDLFARQIRRPDAKGRQTEFNQRVLSAVANRIVGQHRIEVEGAGRSRRARLVQTGAA